MTRLIRVAALFALGCAIWLLALEASPASGRRLLSNIHAETDRSPIERAVSGLESAQRARRAIGAENYGVAAVEVADLERQLTELIAELTPDPRRNDL